MRQVETGISAFEGLVAQAHCLHLEGEVLNTYLATEIMKCVAGQLQSEGMCDAVGGNGANQGWLDGLVEVEVQLIAEGLAQLVERWDTGSKS